MGRRGAGPAARPRSLLRRIADRLAAHTTRHSRAVRKIPDAREGLSSVFLCVLRALGGESSLYPQRKRSPRRPQRKRESGATWAGEIRYHGAGSFPTKFASPAAPAFLGVCA